MRASSPRLIRLRYDGTCVRCRSAVSRGTEAWWDASLRTITCEACRSQLHTGDNGPTGPTFVAGRSAQRTAERRRAKEQAERAQLGGLRRLVEPSQPSAALSWERGAEGERIVGARLDALQERGRIVALHDVRIPNSPANVDHVAVAPSGIHVIDAKLYRGKRVALRNSGGIRRADTRLYVGSRDRTNLVDKLAKQILTVDGAVSEMALPTVVTPVLCFARADWAYSRAGYELNAVRIVWPALLEKILLRAGPLSASQIRVVGDRLRARLRPA